MSKSWRQKLWSLRPKFGVDPHPFDRHGTFPICVISAIHIIEAGLLAFWPVAANATPIASLIYFFAVVGTYIGLPDLIRWLPTIMCLSAAIAIIAALFRLGPMRLALFAPQNILLGVMSIGGLIAAYLNHYLDMTPKPWPHILADQIGFSALFAIHCWAMVRRSRDPHG